MTLSPQITQQYNLGPVKPWVQNAAYIIGPQFGIKTIGGWRQSDPFPDHPTGHALDFMVPDKATGDALAQYEINNWQALGIKYLVWDHRAWNPQIGWHPYTSTNNPHTDHVHTTFNDTPGTATSGTLTGVPIGLSVPADDTCAWKISGTIPVIGGPNICMLSKRGIRMISGAVLMGSGAGFLVVGVLVLVALGFRVNVRAPIVNRLIPAPPVRHYTERHIYHHNVPGEDNDETE